MNSFIETLNQSGGNFLHFAWPMLWQSSLLIAILFALDFLFRRKLRASIRYALWLVVLAKLCVPPTLALPTSPAWWLHKTPPPAAVTHYTVTYDNVPLPEIPQASPPVFVPPKPVMNLAAWLLMISTAISAALLVWLLVRWRQITRQVSRAKTSERLSALAGEAQKFVGMKFNVQVKLTANSMSPAVCGLFRPAILIPQSLADNFSDEQLRAVLLHELIHLRRRDVWLNFLQALLQIFYWWHPLVWLANARIRRVREEAVDDAVMLALRDDAESYATTLLEVAKLALNRPLASLGLVGILESRHALRQRIERLVDFCPPRKVGLTLVSIFGILAFTAVAVPMGEAPKKTNAEIVSPTNNFPPIATNSAPADANNDFSAKIFKINRPTNEDDLKKLLSDAGVKSPTKFFFYAREILFVRGSAGQLALARGVVLKLNGFSSKEIEAANERFLKQMQLPVNPEWDNQLEMRTFKVNAVVFTDALRNNSDLQTTNVSMMAKDFFEKLGVDFDAPGKSIAFNDKVGLLFVKATASDLDTIERAIEALTQVTPQIHLKAYFISVPKKGFVMPLASSNLVAGEMTGILSDTNFRAILHALEQKKDAEILAEPEVVTIGGRQTQMRVTQVKEIPQTGKFETGPTIDLVPYVLADGYTIDLTAIPSIITFLGDEKTDPPVLRRQETTVHVKMWDNQTLVVGNLKSVFVGFTNGVQTTDEPKWVRDAEKKSSDADKEILVFITATIIDPVGNRVHSDDELPFNPSAIPPQN